LLTRFYFSTGSPALIQASVPPSRLYRRVRPAAAAISQARALLWPTAHRKMISLSRLVRLQVDPEIKKKGWDRAARVTVRLKDGSRLSALVIHFKGTPKNPLSPAELEDKVTRLTRGLISARGRARLFEAVDRLERLDRVSSLTSLLRGGA